MKLIDADKVEEEINECVWDAYGSNEDEMGNAYCIARGIIENAPTVDAVPVKWIFNYFGSQLAKELADENEMRSKYGATIEEYFGIIHAKSTALAELIGAWREAQKKGDQYDTGNY